MVLDEACGDALKYNQLGYGQVKSLCAAIAATTTKEVQPALTQTGEQIRDIVEYQNHFDRMVETN